MLRFLAGSRVLRLVGILAAGSAMLVGGLALPAAAHQGTHTVQFSGNMHIVDDDGPDADDVGIGR